MLRQEMHLGYFDMIHRPGEKLGVLDNDSDFECCVQRTHCNATHMCLAPAVVWDEEQGKYILDDTGIDERLKAFRSTLTGRRHTILTGAEHNNVYFPGFYHYRKNLPKALMRDMDGNTLDLHDPDILEGKPIPMPAIDDPDLWTLYARQLAKQASYMPGCHHVAAYVMGGEMMYPEFFSLGKGDYRPESWAHFTAWCQEMGYPVPEKSATLEEGSDARRLWLRFREQAMADRAAWYYQAILNQDDTHLAFYPTHGSALYGYSRQALGQQPDTLSAACDGIEMGHIMVDDDAERRNVIMTCFNSAYGKPVIVPRLGNKTADLGAAGGGRSFTPQLLRRYIYEDLGMGISIIFPIHWRSHLHDGEWFIKDTPAEAECRKVFDEIVAAAPYMMGMGRLQPQVGLLAADDTWLDKWNMRWTALMQDFLTAHVNATIITDSIVDAQLAFRMPLLLLVDAARITEGTWQRLLDYLNAGGKMIVWGAFARNLDEEKRTELLSHKNCLLSQAPAIEKKRIVREMFLTGMREGVTGIRYEIQPVDCGALQKEMKEFAQDTVSRPFLLEDCCTDRTDPRGVNAYPLTDRAGLGCVLVNNGNDTHTLSVKPDPRLMTEAAVLDMLTGREIAMPITLPPCGTMLLYFGKRAKELEEEVCDAEDAFWRWSRLGANIGALRHNFSNMRSGGHYVKRYALAEALLQSLALRCECKAGPDALEVSAEVFDAQGNPVAEGARLELTVTPGRPERYTFAALDGRYVCRIPRQKLLKLYDPAAGCYRPYRGRLRLVIQAEAGEKQGGCMEHVTL